MRLNRYGAVGAVLGWACFFICGCAAAQTLAPTVSQLTSTSVTLTWSTNQALNTQVHYGVGGLNSNSYSWGLVYWHAATLTGLQPGTQYTLEAESSYFSNPDLVSSPLTVTTPGTSGGGAAAMSTPVVTATSGGFTISWTTAQALNSQVHYGQGDTGMTVSNWTLTTNHSLTVANLAAGAQFDVQAESSYFTNPDLLGPVQTVTTLGGGSAGSSSSNTSRLFPSSGANWLYAAPTGTGLNISGITSGMQFQINTHAQGYDYPVQYTNGANGCTTFTDNAIYNYGDKSCVPNPSGGYWPSVGGWGYDDGHLVVVNTTTGDYYDFWKLYVNGSGQPTSTNVGGLFHGNLNTSNGTPGTTAANITGLAGDIMPGELDCATCLNHALSVIVPSNMNSNLVGTQAPASKTDGSVGGAIFREGAKIRFDPSVNVSSLNASTATKAILRALQLYGGVITDQTGGSQIAFYTDLATAPDMTGINLIGQHLFIYY